MNNNNNKKGGLFAIKTQKPILGRITLYTHRLNIPYLRCLEPEVLWTSDFFSDFGIHAYI